MAIERLKRYQRVSSAKRFLVTCETCLYHDACLSRMGWGFQPTGPCVYQPSRWKRRMGACHGIGVEDSRDSEIPIVPDLRRAPSASIGVSG